MANTMTYTTLLEDIGTYAERTDAAFLGQRSRFVMLAENRIASEVRGLGSINIVSANLTPGNPVLVKPERWRETVSFNVKVGINQESKLLPTRSLQYLKTFSPNSDKTGEPRYYGDYDYTHFLIAPAPDDDYAFELVYYERPVPLSELNETNWFTENCPQLLLYACLLEAQPFLKQDARTQQFQALYDRAVQGLGNESMRRMGDASQTRREG
jgi:hypothetical protein